MLNKRYQLANKMTDRAAIIRERTKLFVDDFTEMLNKLQNASMVLHTSNKIHPSIIALLPRATAAAGIDFLISEPIGSGVSPNNFFVAGWFTSNRKRAVGKDVADLRRIKTNLVDFINAGFDAALVTAESLGYLWAKGTIWFESASVAANTIAKLREIYHDRLLVSITVGNKVAVLLMLESFYHEEIERIKRSRCVSVGPRGPPTVIFERVPHPDGTVTLFITPVNQIVSVEKDKKTANDTLDNSPTQHSCQSNVTNAPAQ